MLDKIVRENLRVYDNDGEDFRNFSGFEWSDPISKEELRERLMTKVQQRHHSAHPVSAVKPNLDINKKPNHQPGPAPFADNPNRPFADNPNSLGNASHAPNSPSNTEFPKPKTSDAVPVADNAYDGTDNHNDSPAGTAGLHLS